MPPVATARRLVDVRRETLALSGEALVLRLESWRRGGERVKRGALTLPKALVHAERVPLPCEKVRVVRRAVYHAVERGEAPLSGRRLPRRGGITLRALDNRVEVGLRPVR